MEGYWQEFLILEKLKDHHWLLLDINWCFTEFSFLEAADAPACCRQRAHFAKLDDPTRFADVDLHSVSGLPQQQYGFLFK